MESLVSGSLHFRLHFYILIIFITLENHVIMYYNHHGIIFVCLF